MPIHVKLRTRNVLFCPEHLRVTYNNMIGALTVVILQVRMNLSCSLGLSPSPHLQGKF